MGAINNVGEKIASIRQQKSITTDELAERCGFTVTMMSKIEQNENQRKLCYIWY